MSATPRVLVFRNGQIGNTLVAVPLLRALRVQWPQARIDVVVDRVSRDVLAPCPYVDQLIEYERRERDPLGLKTAGLVRRLRSARYDVAILCKRFTRNELLARLSGAPRRVGFRTPGHRPLGITDPVPYVEGRPIVSLLLDLLDPLGVPAAGEHLEYWWGDRETARFAERVGESDVRPGREFLAVHPRARTQSENIVPPTVFAEVANRFHAERGMPSLFLLGPGEEEVAGDLLGRIEHRAGVLLGEPLGVVAAALDSCRLFVGHDSGPAHLARAVGARGFVIYTDSPGWEVHLAKWGAVSGELQPLRRSDVDAGRLGDRLAALLDEPAPAPP